ncbi:hypothetical protein [Psychromonas sp. SP041]|uniref:hypothetical protein n=1 Tax=Psychromonas sp. SP041 TaxID=1365007 RepID=UPI0010C771C0|nr:hypothetical protein [Psychromonas sp. SP041]
MARALCFEQIVDTRNEGCLEDLVKIKIGIINKLEQFENINITLNDVRELEFNEGAGQMNTSYRQQYQIDKVGRAPTWNEVIKVINSIKAVRYTFISK